MTVPEERRGCCCNVVHIERPLTHARGHPRTTGTGTCTPVFTAAVLCARGIATCLHSLCARAYIPSAGEIPPSARVPFKVELTNLRISSSLMSACKATCQKCQCIVRKWISSSLMFSLREPGRGLTLYLYIYDTGILYDGTTWTFLLYIIFMYVYI